MVKMIEFPEMFEKMPFPYVERVWRYCLWVHEYPQPEPSDEGDQKIIWEDHHAVPFLKFKLLLQRKEIDKEEFKKGINLVVKSWFRIGAGDQKVKNFSFLEHYRNLCHERPPIFDEELHQLLAKYTEEE